MNPGAAMAHQTPILRNLKHTIDFALLPANKTTLVAELQAGDSHDLAAKLNSFRSVATVLDYRHAFAHLWLRVSDLKTTTKLAVNRIRELREAMPAAYSGAWKEKANWWAAYFQHRPADAPTLVASIRDLGIYGLDAHRFVAIIAIVNGIQMFHRLTRDKDAMVTFAVELAEEFGYGEWDVPNSDGDYILGFRG